MGTEAIWIPLAVSAITSGGYLYQGKRQRDTMHRAEEKQDEETARMKSELETKRQQDEAGKTAQLARRRQRLLSGQTAITPYGAIGLSGYTGAGGRQLIGTTGNAAA